MFDSVEWMPLALMNIIAKVKEVGKEKEKLCGCFPFEVKRFYSKFSHRESFH